MTSIINKRKYMQLAISEMRKSRSEHNHKADPLVGAVLIGQDGKLLGKTHRGSLRMGDHAEYTLIERLLTDSDLDGAKLFVTLYCPAIPQEALRRKNYFGTYQQRLYRDARSKS
jgi:tRNA(Arg) A34 adenosine deaminase TadA